MEETPYKTGGRSQCPAVLLRYSEGWNGAVWNSPENTEGVRTRAHQDIIYYQSWLAGKISWEDDWKLANVTSTRRARRRIQGTANLSA